MTFKASDVVSHVMNKLVTDTNAKMDSTAVTALLGHVVKNWLPMKVYVTDIAGDGSTYRFTCATQFTNWVEDVSQIVAIIYPVGYQGENKMNLDEVRVQRTSTGTQELVCVEVTFSSGYTARVHYTGYHQLTESVSTFADGDFLPLCYRVAHDYCLLLAALYNESSNTSLGADNVKYDTKAAEYRRLAVMYDELAKKFRVRKPRTSAFADWDRKLPDGSNLFFHHPDDR